MAAYVAEINSKKLIDEAAALESVGGDKDFLKEIVGDLITEGDSAKESMDAAVAASDFKVLGECAHKVKGAASYISLEKLTTAAKILQDLGYAANDFDSIRVVYPVFVTALEEVKAYANTL